MVQPLYQKNLFKTLGDQTAEAEQENSKERPATFSSLCPLTTCFPQKPKKNSEEIQCYEVLLVNP